MDHYQVLGLSSAGSSVDCTKLSEAEVKAAYRKKALELHPDTVTRKRKRDVDGDDGGDTVVSMTAAFQQLQSSYQALMDKEARKKFDAVWLGRRQEKERRVRLERERQESLRREEERRARMERVRQENERRKQERWVRMERERQENVRRERERIKELEREWEEDIRREEERRMRVERERKESERREQETIREIEEEEMLVHHKLVENIDNEQDIRVFEEEWIVRSKILKVTWNKTDFGVFTESQLKDLFDCFGEVVLIDVSIDEINDKGDALIFMASRASVLAATVASWVHHPESPFVVRPLTLC